MKSKLIILSTAILVFCASQVFAHGGEKHDESKESSMEEKGSMMEDKGSMMEDKELMLEEHDSKLPNVGNAICPVSGELISDVGDGKGVHVP